MCTQTAVPKYAPKHRSSSEMKRQRREENGGGKKKIKSYQSNMRLLQDKVVKTFISKDAIKYSDVLQTTNSHFGARARGGK